MQVTDGCLVLGLILGDGAHKAKIAFDVFTVITVTCCFEMRRCTLIGPLLAITECGNLYISKSKARWSFT